MSKLIELVNGPYSSRVIEDSGAVVIRMGLSTNKQEVGAMIGEAFYRPNAERSKAFFDGNNWIGTLEESFLK